MKTLTIATALLLSLMLASGCMGSSCETTNDAGGQRAVCTTPKTFSYTRNGSMISEKKDYQWENDASKAFISAAFNGATSGSVTVTVKDAAGKTVYSKSQGYSAQEASDEPTTEGKPGAWTISINVGAMTGQVAINVRSA